MKTKAQRRRCRRRRQRRLAADIDFKYFRQKCSGYNTGFFFQPSCTFSFASVFCVPTCGKFGKLISSGGLQKFGPKTCWNFLTRRKHRKQRSRQRSHLYAFTVFRPVCTKFKWQSMTPRLSLPLSLSFPARCIASVSCLPLRGLVAYLFNLGSFFSLLLPLRPFY